MSVGTAEDAGRVLGEDAAGPAWLRGIPHVLLNSVIAQRDRFALWIPVLFGAGIAVYFSITVEPAPWAGGILAAISAMAMLLAWRAPGWRLAFFALSLIAAGFAVAQGRTHAVAAPVLARDFGPGWVTGRVVELDRRPEGTRAILDRPALEGLEADETPARVRVRLRRGDDAQVGDTIRLRAKLAPPAAPAMPGAYDFQRHAWFQRIGGVGFAYTHAARIAGAGASGGASAASLWLAHLRLSIADRIRAAVPGTAGAVAAALITGDRSAIPEETIQAMRDSGLAHLLAISGLHVGLAAGILFFGIRLLLALVEPVALRFPIKKVAAGCAFAGALVYLLLSGATVPTQRAFVMTGIVLAAVLLDRTAISLRLVAWAAMVVLLLQPESLMGPSFQMSFAAVLSLVAAYEGLRGPLRRWRAGGGMVRKIELYLAGLTISTLVAGTATGVIALHHFGRFSVYGLVANLIAIPLAGLWIMPWGVLACVLMPFGQEGWALAPMAWGIDVMLDAARLVAAWPSASVQVPAMPGWGLALAAFGGIWLCLWRRPVRWAGAAGILAGLLSVALTQPPDILVDGGGKLIAVRTADGGLSLSSKRSGKFAARIWQERGGDEDATAWPETSSADSRLTCDSIGCLYRAGGRTVALVRDERAFADDCTAGMVVVSTVPARRHCRGADRVVDRFDLWRNGAYALWLGRDGVRVLSVREARGDRLWTGAPPARKRPKAKEMALSTAASGRRGGPAP